MDSTVNKQLNKVVFESLPGIHLIQQQIRVCFNPAKPLVLVFNPHVGL
jgi:hypothetical protein